MKLSELKKIIDDFYKNNSQDTVDNLNIKAYVLYDASYGPNYKEVDILNNFRWSTSLGSEEFDLTFYTFDENEYYAGTYDKIWYNNLSLCQKIKYTVSRKIKNCYYYLINWINEKFEKQESEKCD